MYEPPAHTIDLLVLGGSLGARIFSDIVPDAVALLPEDLRGRLKITQQCRAEDLERARATYRACGVTAELAPFFNNVAALLRSAHLMIGRAGASTCAELAVAGRPSILVPLPGAIDDHQTANAAALANAGGAQVIAQPEFTADRLAALLQSLLADPASLVKAAAAAASTAKPRAAAALADMLEHETAQREFAA
jgi:UDP-N-acetylglucosamine--N-acetylmuramyl-(pentapeptide) pyrophosphoryl-undecaprenol N-acetylglucosamine transferase